MFSKATANFLHQIDPEGSLIHVSRVNDSKKLIPMALVVKRKPMWFWQRPKYRPTDFILSDLLKVGEVLIPGVSQTDFVSYEGTYGDESSGELEAEAGSVSATLKGQGTSELQSCFSKLKKEELDVKKLLEDCKNRLVNMEHVLVQQLHKRTDVLAVVKERIFTTTPCPVTETKKQQCMFQGVVKQLGNCVKGAGKDSNKSAVSLKIPSGTVIAYSILELEIKKSGEFDICLQPEAIGGFEADTVLMCNDSLCEVDGICNGQSQEMDLSPLAELPQSTRCAFTKMLQETLKDRAALSDLQWVLEESCSGETLNVDKEEEHLEVPRTSMLAVLDQPGFDGHTENSQCGAPLKAAYLLVSAIEELPDETVSLLSESSPDFLEAFDVLLCRLKDSREPVSIQSLPVLLQENQTFQLAEQLLSSTSVTLKRDNDRLWIETDSQAEVLPLVFSLSIHGLSLLCSGL